MDIYISDVTKLPCLALFYNMFARL